MSATPERSERLVCAVLAAQVGAIRDRMESGATVDLIWRTVDLMSRLSGLVTEFSQNVAAVDPEQSERFKSVLAAESEISQSLENVAFLQAQCLDLTRQMADCVVTGLERMAAVTAPDEAALSPGELAALYVSEEQRAVHEAVTHQFGLNVLRETLQTRIENRKREGADE